MGSEPQSPGVEDAPRLPLSVRLCGTYGQRRRTTDGRIVVTAHHCKNWQCERCGPRNRGKLRHRLKEVGLAPSGMLTLTTDPKRLKAAGVEPRTEAERDWLKESWSRLRQRLRRSHLSGVGFAYFWAKEPHQDGRLHMHVLLWDFGGKDGRVSKKDLEWIRDTAYACGFGRTRWDPTRGEAGRVESYITKSTAYTSKLKAYEYPYRVRRYGASRGLLPKLEALTGLPEGMEWDEESEARTGALWEIVNHCTAVYGEPEVIPDSCDPKEPRALVFVDKLRQTVEAVVESIRGPAPLSLSLTE